MKEEDSNKKLTMIRIAVLLMMLIIPIITDNIGDLLFNISKEPMIMKREKTCLIMISTTVSL